MTLAELAAAHTRLSDAEVEHLQRLAVSWGLLADLCFSDLLLLAPTAAEAGHRFVVLGHVRPTTSQTLYPDDLVGSMVDEVERPLVARAWRLDEIASGDAVVLRGGERVRIQVVPVCRRGRLVGVLSRETGTSPGRRAGELERFYQEIFDRFAKMIHAGDFPFADERGETDESPRVGDGVVVLDPDGRVRYASPNAVSCLHRLGVHGHSPGQRLSEAGFDDGAVRTAMSALLPVDEELEWGAVSILVRVIPLLDAGRADGAVVLMRDVSDLRRRDRMLLSKDATIREIHHRVKNNLQTIAALLRLQGRRLSSVEARVAIDESVRRIRSIALVHETLAYEAGNVVPFREILRPLVRIVEDGLLAPERRVEIQVTGDPGDLPAEVATPLAVVLTELIQNAVEHAFPAGEGGEARRGRVTVDVSREGDFAVVDVRDDGVGLPEGFSIVASSGLGLSIVHTLVTSELAGSIEMRSDSGTLVRVRVPVAFAPRVDL